MRNAKLAAKIAKELRRFHQVEIPGSKEPQLWIDMFKFFEKGILVFDDQLTILYVPRLFLAKLVFGDWKWSAILPGWQFPY